MAVRDDFAAGEVLAAADLNDTFASKLDVIGGRILQIVRQTDAADRSTTSTSPVDASLSVTITPLKTTSYILVLFTGSVASGSTTGAANLQITDASNNVLQGAEFIQLSDDANAATLTGIGYSTPATTSATTYKLRFYVGGTGTASIQGSSRNTTQLIAIEVSEAA